MCGYILLFILCTFMPECEELSIFSTILGFSIFTWNTSSVWNWLWPLMVRWNPTCLFFSSTNLLSCTVSLLSYDASFPHADSFNLAGLVPTGALSYQRRSTAGRLGWSRSETELVSWTHSSPAAFLLDSSCPRGILVFLSPHLKALKALWIGLTTKRKRLFRESNLMWLPDLITESITFQLFWGRLSHRHRVCILENRPAPTNMGGTHLETALLHRPARSTGADATPLSRNQPGVPGPELKEVCEILCQFACVDDFFSGRGLSEPVSTFMGRFLFPKTVLRVKGWN